jgi:hypothetical protein
MIRRSRSVDLVCLRCGIIAPRSVQPASRRGDGGSVPVGRLNAGMSSLPPGTVRQVCPDGEIQITVPSAGGVTVERR